MLLQEGTEQTSVLDSFARADEWIGRGVKSIWGMLSRTGLINVDFTALRQVFRQRGGKTLSRSRRRWRRKSGAQAALEDLKQCPLLHTPEYARKADRLLVNITGGADLSLTKVNELMTAITEEFGREAHVVMGAAIDEGLHGQVEICVIGTTDLGSRNFTATPHDSAVAQEFREIRGDQHEFRDHRNPDRGESIAASTATEREIAKAESAKAMQEEFGFQGEPVENRGSFDKSDRNLFEGQDLDVPTYLRKGIKIAV